MKKELAAIKRLLDLHLAELEGIPSGMPTKEQWLDAVDRAWEAYNRLNAITPPTREEIRQAAQGEADFESFMDGANWAIYKILNQKP